VVLLCGSEAERLDVVYDKVVLNLRRLDHLFAQHVDDFDGEAGGGRGGGELVVAGDPSSFFSGTPERVMSKTWPS
jgi:hypothetical protein